MNPRVAVDLLLSQWEEIEKVERDQMVPACIRPRGEVEQGHGKWVKPPFQTIKVNCDGAWHKHTGKWEIG